MKAYDKQFVGGVWREGCGEKTLENRNPWSGELLYSYRAAGKKDVDDAYEAAKRAQKEWYALTPDERTNAMERLRQTIVSFAPVMDECLLKENGSIAPKRSYECGDSAKFARWFSSYPYLMDGRIQVSDTPGQSNFIFREPKGVITVIPPWNVPFILAFKSILPAVAAGNAVVLKPASDCPASGFIIGEIFEKAGLPKGLINVITGSGSEIGDYIVEHPLCDMVSFTGSTEVGKRIGEKCGTAVRDVSLELGGNNSMILLPDADVEKAADSSVFGAFFHQGQICMSLNRVIAVGDTYERYAEKIAQNVKALKAGDPADPETFIGPMINENQIRHFEQLLDETLQAGAQVIVEGKTEGSIVHPWVLGEITNDMASARNEMFGPIVSLMHAKDEDEAVAIANDTNYGLSNSVFGKDVYHAMQVALRMESGMVHVNDQPIGEEIHVMFGPEKESGIGRFNGTWSLDKFTTQKWISALV